MADRDFLQSMADLATELIGDFGRELTLIKFSEGSDIAQPWKGTVPATQGTRLPLNAVVVGSGTLLGQRVVSDDLLKQVKSVAYFAPAGNDLSAYDAVEDNAKQFRIVWKVLLTPGPIDIPILAYIGFDK